MKFGLFKKIDKFLRPQNYTIDSVKKPLSKLEEGDTIYFMLLPNLNDWYTENFPILTQSIMVGKFNVGDKFVIGRNTYIRFERPTDIAVIEKLKSSEVVRSYGRQMLIEMPFLKSKQYAYIKVTWYYGYFILTTDKNAIYHHLNVFLKTAKSTIQIQNHSAAIISMEDINTFKQEINTISKQIYNL